MRINLRYYEVIDIEELRDLLHRQVSLDAAVAVVRVLLVALFSDLARARPLVLGSKLPGGLLADERNAIEDSRDSTTRHRSTPDAQVRSREVI